MNMLSIHAWFVIYTTMNNFVNHTAMGQSFNQSKSLFDNLLVGYHKLIRPLEDQSRAVHVNISLILTAMNGLDTVSGELTTTGALMCTWKDDHLGWDPMTNGGIHSVVVPQYSIWKPVVVVGNPTRQIIAFGHDQDEFLYARVTHDGTVTWNPSGVIHTACSVDVTYFPFDIQICSVWFAPWGYPSTEVYLNPSHANMNLTFLETNSEWIVKEASSFQGVLSATSQAGYNMKLERRSAYYVVNLLMPVSFLTLLNVLVFLIPVESGERVSYSITVLLSIAVFMTIFGDAMPKGSEKISMLSYFMMGTIGYSALITFVTIINLRIHHKPRDAPIPRWLACITRSYMWIKRNNSRRSNSSVQVHQKLSITSVQTTTDASDTVKNDIHVDIDADGGNVDWETTAAIVDALSFIICFMWIIVSAVALIFAILCPKFVSD
jgi:hypothetical protein